MSNSNIDITNNSNLIGNETQNTIVNNSLLSDTKNESNILGNTNNQSDLEDKEKFTRLIDDGMKMTANKGVKDIINFEEVAIQRALFFRLYIQGAIEFGNFYSSDSLFGNISPLNIKYEFVHGADWEQEEGILKDTSQFTCKGDGTYSYYTFNHQFEISYRSINPFGWPQLVLTCCTVDSDGNEQVKGYGCVNVPASVGRHERIVHIFSYTSNQSYFYKSPFRYFLCCCCSQKKKQNRVINTPRVISTGEGREISRAVNEGWVKVTFQVGFRDMEKFGLVTS